MASDEAPPSAAAAPATLAKYSRRVLLKTILDRGDGGFGSIGERVVVGGWVKSSKEEMKEKAPPPPPGAAAEEERLKAAKDVSCVEILQSRFPFFRTIVRVLGGSNHPLREKLEAVLQKLPPPSVAILQNSDGSCVPSLQVVVDSSVFPPSQVLPTGTCVLVEGVLVQPSAMAKQIIELKVEKILFLGTVDEDKYPLSKKRLPLDTLRDCPHFRPRTTTVASVMRIRSALTLATHTFFQNSGFRHVHVPIITITDAEGFSEKFTVTTLHGKVGNWKPNDKNDVDGVSLEVIKGSMKEKSNVVEALKRTESNEEALAAAIQDLRKTNELVSHLEAREKLKAGASLKEGEVTVSEDFFSQPTYLTVSGRLHLESYACSLGNVYSFGPTFRADKTESSKHIAEMYGMDIQIAFSQLEDAINCADDCLKFICNWVLKNCSEDMKFISKRIDKTSTERLESIISSSYEKMTYKDAVATLKKLTNKVFQTKLEHADAPLLAEHLSYLADEIYKKPVIIYNYPKGLKPFYVRLNGDGETVAAFEMVVPKVGRLITGSQSEERINMLNTRIKELGLPKEQYEWYLDLRRHGTVKQSGFSLGFDLMVLFITGLTDVRDVIPFPRSYDGKVKN